MGAIQEVIARFVVDESDNPIPFDKAVELLDDVSLSDMAGVVEKFTNLLKDTAINPPTAVS